jgi:NDP-sugar pyrophosphorylase family protein
MKAMILAAGLGTRLRPLTNDRPKALVTVGGRTLLEIALSRLRTFGVCEVIVNAHHYAEMIADYLEMNDNFGMRIAVSREETLLDTGGGLKKAAWFFNGGEGAGESFFVHNVDVLSNIDLEGMMHFHAERNALATVATQDRETSRYLLFNAQDQLCGHRAGKDGTPEFVRAALEFRALAFCGIHILSPQIFSKMQEDGVFSIIGSYLHLAAQGEKIIAFSADGAYWRDLGRPQNLVDAARDLANGTYSQS